jgi:hypothetical protein
MTWVLIIIASIDVYGGGHVAVSQVDFASREACQVAAKLIHEKYVAGRAQTSAFCVDRGR